MSRRTVSYFGMSKRLYADSKAPDGVVSRGWRKVRKGGLVKIAAIWWHAPELETIPPGELVLVQIGDYWMSDVLVFRGAFDCRQYFCTATAFDGKRNERNSKNFA